MIEINLVPDVKQELINAQRVRTTVISLSILAGLAAIAVVVLLAVWVFGVQAARGALSDDTIKKESDKLAQVDDISNTLTIQNQLNKLPEMHNNKSIDSRIFDVLTTINPPAPNNVMISNLSLDSEAKTITIEGQAANGFPAFEIFKKTINATNIEFTMDGEKRTVPLAADMSEGDRNYGEDASGARVVRFAVSFTYPVELFSRTVDGVTIVAPARRNATDSFLGVPNSLFSPKADAAREGN